MKPAPAREASHRRRRHGEKPPGLSAPSVTFVESFTRQDGPLVCREIPPAGLAGCRNLGCGKRPTGVWPRISLRLAKRNAERKGRDAWSSFLRTYRQGAACRRLLQASGAQEPIPDANPSP